MTTTQGQAPIDTNTASGAADKALAYLDALSDDAAAHIFPSDLAKCMASECVVEVCSVRAGNPNEKTVPLFSREQVVAALASAAAPAEQPGEIQNLRKALQFYADKDHFNIADEGAWDTVSGEPQNYWCDEEGTATVEDGTIARLALAGHQIKFDADNAPQPSPTPQADSQPAAALEITAPNDSGSTQCIVRWQVETPKGWAGAWNREALEYLIGRTPADSATAPAATCPTCKAPCTTTVNMRGGEYGWGTTDLERTVYHYAPAQAADSVLEDAARYRWLREQSFDTWKLIAWNTWNNDPAVWPDRDAAIDAARKQGGA